MSAFTLDTSGAVYTPKPTPNTMMPGRTEWSDLSPFEQGYVEACLRALVITDADILDHIERSGCSPLPGFSDLHPETLSAIRKDCAAYAGPFFKSDGSTVWAMRQKGLQPQLPPLTVALDDAEKVVFA